MTKQSSDIKFVVQRGGAGHNDDDLRAVHGFGSPEIITVVDDVRNGNYASRGKAYVDVTEARYGAVCDAGRVLDVSINVSTNPLLMLSATVGTSSGNGAAPTVGQNIWIEGAGVAGAVHHTTITAISAGVSVTLAAPASTTVSAKKAVWGTDDTAAINLASLSADRILIPGFSIVSAPLLINGTGTVFMGKSRGLCQLEVVASNFSVFKGADPTVRYQHCGFEGIQVDSILGFTGIKAFDFSRLGSSWMLNCGAALRDSACYGIYVSDADDGTGPYYCEIILPNFSLGAGKTDSYGIYFGRSGDSLHRSANSWTILGGRISGGGVGAYIQGEGHEISNTRFESIATACIQAGDDSTAASCTGSKFYATFEGSSSAVAYLLGATTSSIDYGWGTHTGLAAQPITDNSGGANKGPNAATALTTTTLVSGTAKQIVTKSGIFVQIPVTMSPTGIAAATCAVAIGPDNTTAFSLPTISSPATAVAGDIRVVNLWLPCGWYVKATVTNATLGTVSYWNN